MGVTRLLLLGPFYYIQTSFSILFCTRLYVALSKQANDQFSNKRWEEITVQIYIHKPLSSQYLNRVATKSFQQSSFHNWSFDKNHYDNTHRYSQDCLALQEWFKKWHFYQHFLKAKLKLHNFMQVNFSPCPISFFCRYVSY